MRCGREAFGLANWRASVFLAAALVVGMMVLPGCGCGGETPGGTTYTYGEISLTLAWPTVAAPAGAVSIPEDTELVRIRVYSGGTELASYEGQAFPCEKVRVGVRNAYREPVEPGHMRAGASKNISEGLYNYLERKNAGVD